MYFYLAIYLSQEKCVFFLSSYQKKSTIIIVSLIRFDGEVILLIKRCLISAKYTAKQFYKPKLPVIFWFMIMTHTI